MRPEPIIAFFLEAANRNREAALGLVHSMGQREGAAAAGLAAHYARLCGFDLTAEEAQAMALAAGADRGGADGGGSSGKGERILVVEDEADILDYMAKILREDGFEVYEAPDAREAMRILRSGAGIQLVLSDIGLPGGTDGIALAKAALGEIPELKVMFVSGNAQGTLAEHGMEASDVELVTKPFLPADLLATVRRILDAECASRPSSEPLRPS